MNILHIVMLSIELSWLGSLIKVNSNTIELIVHTSCYCALDLLCVIIIFQSLTNYCDISRKCKKDKVFEQCYRDLNGSASDRTSEQLRRFCEIIHKANFPSSLIETKLRFNLISSVKASS